MPNPVKDGATGGRDIGPWQGICRRCGPITEASGDFQAVSRQTYNHKPARHHVSIRRLGVTAGPECNCGCHGIPDREPWLCEACGHGEPRAVAEFECYTCQYYSDGMVMGPIPAHEYCRTANHDIRPAGGKRP